MLMNNSVIFKGGKDGIIIQLDPDVDFTTIEQALTDKIKDARKFFGDTKTNIFFRGRELEAGEEERLLSIIINEGNLDVVFTETTLGRSFTAQPLPAPPAEEQIVSEVENMTYHHSGSLRSGQTIRYAGSVIIIGDVNPGAEVVAEGNIIIMGSLKGLAHAGCRGNNRCYVTALNMQPTQLRIADVITIIPNEMAKKFKARLHPVYAYVKDGQIFIEPLYETDSV